MPLFEHECVVLRMVSERDLARISEVRNDFSTWSNLGDPRPLKPGRQGAWLAGVDASPDRFYFMAEGPDGVFLGIVRMDEYDVVNRSIRVGLDIAPEKRGKGWGTKVFMAILKYVFDYLGVHRAWLLVLETNKPALGLYRKMGFRQEGRFRQAIWRDGRWVDYLVMSVLEGEYRR